MKATVRARDIIITEEEKLVAGSVNEYRIIFEFPEEWDGYSKEAVFRDQAGTMRAVVLSYDGEDLVAAIPHEVLADTGYIQVGVYGTKTNHLRPTVWSKMMQVFEGTEDADPSTPEEQTPWQAALTQMGEDVEDSHDNAETAEAYAVGKRGGVDVESTDPAYHNNSKYFAQQAASEAGDASGSAADAATAKTAAETAQGKAEDAQGAAETAQGKAEDAQDAAETAQGKAEDAQTAAETAQGAAEDAQAAAEAAQGLAETAQGAAEAAEDGAELWATGGSGGTASATNNAKYYSVQAAASAAEAEAAVASASAAYYYIDESLFENPTTTSSNAAEVINAALAAAQSNGNNYCVIPCGEYWLTETVYLVDGVILKGCGMDATTLKIADDCDIDAIRVSEPVSNSGIMDLTIDGNRIQNYSTFSNGHHGNAINIWLHYGIIERVRTNWVYKHSLMLNYDTGSGDDGLGFDQEHQNDMGNLNKVLWCDFRDSLLQGVMWGWRTMDSWMCYCNIGSHAANLYLEGGTSRFIGNHFDGDGDNGNGPEYNVYCADGCTAMVFVDNIFENTQKENIYFRKPSYSNKTRTITIANNIIRTCSKATNETYANIFISGYSSSVKAEQIVISGNQILNPNTNGNNGYAGIHLDLCKDVKISGNSYFNVGDDDVKLESTCENVVNDDDIPGIESDITEIEGDIGDLSDGLTATKGMLAPAYSTSATYAVGDHVTYNGGYYVCKTAITTAEAWTAAHWTQVTVGGEAADLKSAFDSVTEIVNLFKPEDGTVSGVTLANLSDGSFKLNGTAPGAGADFIGCVLSAGTYKMAISTVSGTGGTVAVRYYASAGDDTTVWSNGAEKTFAETMTVIVRAGKGTYTNLIKTVTITKTGSELTAVDKDARANLDTAVTSINGSISSLNTSVTALNEYKLPGNLMSKYNVFTCVDKTAVKIDEDSVVIAYGDSITYGSENEDNKSWVNILQEKYGFTLYKKAHTGGMYGHGRDEEYWISTQLAGTTDAQFEAATLVIFAAGTNDAAYETAYSDLKSYVQSAITYVRTKNADVPILFITPIKRGGTSQSDARDKIPYVSGIIENVALKNGCSVICGWDFPIPSVDQGEIEGFMGTGHVHPGPIGQQIYARSVLNAIL